jgi:hypothetical protein
MTGEEMERAIEFLLQSQANSEARLGRLEGVVEQLAVAQGRSQEQMDELRLQVSHVAKVAEIALETSQRNSADIDALVKLVGGIIQRGNGGANQDG